MSVGVGISLPVARCSVMGKRIEGKAQACAHSVHRDECRRTNVHETPHTRVRGLHTEEDVCSEWACS